MDPKKMKSVYTIVERNGKSYWRALGVGFVNSDGSINIKLDATPANFTLQVRDYEPRDEKRNDTNGASPRRSAFQQDAAAG